MLEVKTMKICPKCGEKNKDIAKFCESCGGSLENIAPMGTQANNKSPGNKNKWIAPILDIIGGLLLYCLSGIGQILYLRLIKRGLVLCAIGFFITIITGIVAMFHDSYALTLISLFAGLALTFYSARDAYACSEAINEGRSIPPLFGSLDTESLTNKHVIAIIVICLIGLVALFGAAMVSPDLDATPQIVNDVTDVVKNDDSSSNEALQIKITYPGEWTASIGDKNNSNYYEGTGDKLFNIDEDDYDVIAAAVQKKTSGSDTLKVEVIKDGNVVDKESTTEEYGVVTVSTTI